MQCAIRNLAIFFGFCFGLVSLSSLSRAEMTSAENDIPTILLPAAWEAAVTARSAAFVFSRATWGRDETAWAGGGAHLLVGRRWMLRRGSSPTAQSLVGGGVHVEQDLLVLSNLFADYSCEVTRERAWHGAKCARSTFTHRSHGRAVMGYTGLGASAILPISDWILGQASAHPFNAVSRISFGVSYLNVRDLTPAFSFQFGAALEYHITSHVAARVGVTALARWSDAANDIELKKADPTTIHASEAAILLMPEVSGSYFW